MDMSAGRWTGRTRRFILNPAVERARAIYHVDSTRMFGRIVNYGAVDENREFLRVFNMIVFQLPNLGSSHGRAGVYPEDWAGDSNPSAGLIGFAALNPCYALC